MSVAREVDVDLVFRLYRGLVSPGAAALDAEDGAQGRLPKRGHDAPAQLSKALVQPHRRRRLALSRAGRGDPRDHHQLASLPVLPDRLQGYLRLVVTLRDHQLRVQAHLHGDFGYG